MDICPSCAEELPEGERVWFVGGKFYCSESCARKAERSR